MADHLSVFRLRVAAGDVFDADPLTDSKSVWTITPVVFNDGVDGSWMYITVKMYPCSGGTDTGSPEL